MTEHHCGDSAVKTLQQNIIAAIRLKNITPEHHCKILLKNITTEHHFSDSAEKHYNRTSMQRFGS